MRTRGSFQLVAGPTVEPVDAQDFTLHHLKIDFADDSLYIADTLVDAREDLEGEYETCFITQSWSYVLDYFPGATAAPWFSGWSPVRNWIEIPKSPMQSVTSVTYLDTSGNPQTLSTAVYDVDVISTPPRIALKPGQAWPATDLQRINSVTILGVYGYGDTAAKVPPRARRAIRLLAAHFYENREENVIAQRIRPLELPWGVKKIMRSLDWRSLVA